MAEITCLACGRVGNKPIGMTIKRDGEYPAIRVEVRVTQKLELRDYNNDDASLCPECMRRFILRALDDVGEFGLPSDFAFEAPVCLR